MKNRFMKQPPAMCPRYRTFECTSVKAVKDETTGLYTRFVGYATKWDVVDTYGEVVDRTAFDKTLAEGLPARSIYLLIDHSRSVRDIIGTIVAATKDEYGLLIEAEVSSVGYAQEVMKLVDEGHAKYMSIGFWLVNSKVETIDSVEVVHLTEIKLGEVSIVLFPANNGATVVGTKSLALQPTLPFASMKRPYDESDAIERIAKWAGITDGKVNAKYRSAFVYCDGDTTADCKLPIADVIDEQLMVIPKAVAVAGATLMGYNGGIELSDETAVATVFDGLFKQMSEHFKTELPPPWQYKTNLSTIAFLASWGALITEDLKASFEAIMRELNREASSEVDKPGAAPLDVSTETVKSAQARLRAVGIKYNIRG